MDEQLAWHAGLVDLTFAWTDDSPVELTSWATGDTRAVFTERLPLVELLAVGFGHWVANDRLIHTELGRSLRYRDHSVQEADDARQLTIRSASPADGIRVETVFTVPRGTSVVRVEHVVTAVGAEPLLLQSVASLAWTLGSPLGVPENDERTTSPLDETTSPLDEWNLLEAASTWLGEGRWSITPLRPDLLPALSHTLTDHDPRGEHRVVSSGTWSTGSSAPVGAALAPGLGLAWLWQIEHNGAWRWEVGQAGDDGYVALAGPTDVDHQWFKVLRPGESFRTVPAALALDTDLEHAVARMTEYRRAGHAHRVEGDRPLIVFNDYMNTIDGDPTTEKLLPLVSAAGDVGAEIFCIDAGWYDDTGTWWDTVGEWRPSTTRFPHGLGEVIDAIRSRGMVPGLWLEPESVGVRSPLADALPTAAFLQRAGRRVVEQQRYFLDLRHPAAREHLDGVVDRLIRDFGIGYFKFDYNVSPGAGTDRDADSAGDGLLEHNRAYLSWVDGLFARHPDLILENCGSGGMRADPAQLSLFQLQSTSDQQDLRRYPVIAAAAPMLMPPEQAANWAYPQAVLSPEENVMTLVTTMLGRFFLSGYINRMDPAERELVAEAIRAYRTWVQPSLTASLPFWPAGLPAWDDPILAAGLHLPAPATDRSTTSRSTPAEPYDLVAVWSRGGGGKARLRLPAWQGSDIRVETVFPTRPGFAVWPAHWDPESAELIVSPPDSGLGARVLAIHRPTTG